jgi:DNA-binding LacI/PurR family transcriptional regulator
MAGTSADVARLAGVSRPTVSQILNGKGHLFALATRTRVENAARELDYQPSLAGRALARGSSDVVIALVPDATLGQSLQDLVDVLTVKLADQGLILLLRFSGTTETLERALISIRPRAVLALGTLTEPELAVMHRTRIQVVGSGKDGWQEGNRAIGALQADYLISRGHSRLAFAHLRDQRQYPFGEPREQGFRDRCAELGLEPPKTLRLAITADQASAELRRVETHPIAVACYNDDVATALHSAARTMNIDIPAGLALIGMDNTAMAQLLAPPLTTVRVDVAQSASDIAEDILHELNGTEPPRREPSVLHVVAGGTA